MAASFPQPAPGLVIRYSYLWLREHLAGHDEGQKDRPCAIIAAIASDAGDTRVLVLPVTHSPPSDPRLGVEIPAKVKSRLGLDQERSWVVLSEWNEFLWPGPDLRRAPGADDGAIAYGFLPPALFQIIRERLIALIEAGKAQSVSRT